MEGKAAVIVPNQQYAPNMSLPSPPPVTMVSAPQPVYFNQQPPPTPMVDPTYKPTQRQGIQLPSLTGSPILIEGVIRGAITIFLGIIIFGLVVHSIGKFGGDTSIGFWGGIIMIMSGVISITSARYTNNQLLRNSEVIFLILGCIVSFGMLLVYPFYAYHYRDDERCRYGVQSFKGDHYKCKTARQVYGGIAGLSAIQMIVYILGGIFKCVRNPCHGQNIESS